MSADPELLSVSQAAALAHVGHGTFNEWLKDEKFNAAVVVDVPGKRVRISRPRLIRYLHGDAAA